MQKIKRSWMLFLDYVSPALKLKPEARMRIRNRGYTLIELMVAIWGLLVVVLCGVGIYIVYHFIAKYW